MRSTRSIPTWLLAWALASHSAGAVQARSAATAAQQVGDLVVDARGNRVLPLSLARQDFLIIYRASERSEPCRGFTPELIRFYTQHHQAHAFDVVLLSADVDRESMLEHMRRQSMPWYAVEFDSSQARALLGRMPGEGLPALMILDKAGAVVADSWSGGNALQPPQEVLKAFALHLRAEADSVTATTTARSEENTVAQIEERLRTAPDQVSVEDIRRAYPVGGFLNSGGKPHAMIRQEIVGVGDRLSNGAVVTAIDRNRVRIELRGRAIDLQPAAIGQP